MEEDDEAQEDYKWREWDVVLSGESFGMTTGTIQQDLIRHFHDSRLEGYSGIYWTWARMAYSFIWTGMKNDVKKYIP